MATKAKQEQVNGTVSEAPKSFTLRLEDYELNLLHQVLANGTFQQVQAKQIAASVQQKIEALVQE